MTPSLVIELALVVSLGAAADDAPRPKLIVLDAIGGELAAPQLQRLNAHLLERLALSGDYRVVGGDELRALVEFVGLRQGLGCREASCLETLGEALEAELVARTTVTGSGDTWVLDFQIVNAEHGGVVAHAAASALSPEELPAAAAAAVADVTGGADAAVATPDFVLAAGEDNRMELAVLDLGADEATASLAASLTQVVSIALKELDGFSVISTDEIRSMLAFEEQKQLMGCDDESCLAEIGGALGVRYVVAGQLGVMGEAYLLHLKLIDIERATTVHRVAESFIGGQENLPGAARVAARKLVGREMVGEGEVEVRPSADDSWRLVVDGEAREAVERHQLGAGKHNLRLEMDGHYPWVSDVYVEPRGLVRLDVQLVALPRPWYREWWVWAVGGAVVLGGAGLGLYFGMRDTTGTLSVTAPVPAPGR